MSNKPAIYDSSLSKELSINTLIEVFKNKDVMHIYYKLLSPNDNSKNQPYLAGHLTDLGFMPTGEVTESNQLQIKLVILKDK